MMQEAIKNFPRQFLYEPQIENVERLRQYARFVVIGMGGSHLAADILKTWDPALPLIIHSDYGLPPLPEEDLQSHLVIVSSYSGNTEETIDGFMEAGKRGYARAAVSVGGKLLALAKQEGVPYIKMLDTGIQPRSALGLTARALLKLMGRAEALSEMSKLEQLLDIATSEEEGKQLAERLRGKIPVIYASGRNAAIASNWKIKFNETAKIPAFYNVFPELNHNEMTGFDVTESTKDLSDKFYFIFLRDSGDHPRALKRMETTERLFRDRNLPVEIRELFGINTFHKIFSSLLLADWAAYWTATLYGVESEQVPMVEELKRRLAS